jgi:glycosyltransferase involved in cell wall biosynthesis
VRVKVYVYPWSTKAANGLRNPYVSNFIDSLASRCTVVNRDRPTPYGLFGVVPWLRHLDVLILHWAGNIPDRRGAAAQVALLRLILLAKSAIGLRVVFVLHDKVSHATTRFRLKQQVVRSVLRRADLVLTHARDGIDFAVTMCPSVRDRIRCLPHPFDSSRAFVSGDEPFEHRQYDLLIWGRMAPYKGLGEFVRFLDLHGLQARYRILVAGQFPDAAAFETLSREAPHVTFDNRFIPDAELRTLMAASKVILFPYRPDTVIGSSALMDALLTDAIVIGPRAGAFRDCEELGLVSTFGDLSELPQVIERALAADRTVLVQKRRAFAAQHTWEEFGRTLTSLLGR